LSHPTDLVHASYSDVERRMWNDAWFRSLTPVPPCGQALWIYLLTTPHLGALPGLICMGEASMAEHLKWPLDGFRAAFAEVAKRGTVAADWDARLVVVFNAIGRRRPESANVIKSWRKQWFDVPECELKRLYYQHLSSFTTDWTEGLRIAFSEAIEQPLPLSGTATVTGTQNRNTSVLDPAASPALVGQPRPADPAPTGTVQAPIALTLTPLEPAVDEPREVWEHYLAGWRKHVRGTRPPAWDAKRRKLALARLREFSLADLKLAIDGLWSSTWHIENGFTAYDLVLRDRKHVEQFIGKIERPSSIRATGLVPTQPRARNGEYDWRATEAAKRNLSGGEG
jgi:hypothetical protein